MLSSFVRMATSVGLVIALAQPALPASPAPERASSATTVKTKIEDRTAVRATAHSNHAAPIEEKSADQAHALSSLRSGGGASKGGASRGGAVEHLSAGSESSERDPVRAGLAKAEIVDRKPLGGGVNATEVVTMRLADGTTAKGVFKSQAGEAAGLRKNVQKGTYYKREVAVSRLNDALGLDLVPTTVEMKTPTGEVGSVQLFVENARAGQNSQLDRASAEKLRIFDYITGNADRHGGNLMTKEGSTPPKAIAIDNGLALPNGVNTLYRFPAERINTHVGPLLPESRSFINGIDERTVANVLAHSDIEQTAIVHVLRRIERLKADPSFVEVKSANGGYATVSTMGKEALVETQGLSKETLDRIDAVAADAMNAR